MGTPLEPGWVRIIHEETGGITEVHRDGLQAYYQSGWALLTADNAPPAQEAPPEPAPASEAQVADKRAARAKKAAAAEDDNKPADDAGKE